MHRSNMENNYLENNLLSDAHAHISTKEDLDHRKRFHIPTLFSAGTPEEAAQLLECCGAAVSEAAVSEADTSEGDTSDRRLFLPTIGLHPWHAAEYIIDDMLPFLDSAPVIGEIGMDSVWCEVPLELQEKVFRAQLALAREQKKPVILHTKGQEKEIAAILREYPNRYLVHWYSCDRYLEDYLALDCFFSIGPDVWWNPAVQAVAKTVPDNRLLMETDGLDAVSWAWEEAVNIRKPVPPFLKSTSFSFPFQTTPAPSGAADALTAILLTVAQLRELPPQEVVLLCRQNLCEGFLNL